jgi:homoserine O-acetyltransferase
VGNLAESLPLLTAAEQLQHPPLQPDWVDAPHYLVSLGDFPLESGEVIEEFIISFAAHGDLCDDRLPIALTLCAIGSTHHRMDFMIGAGRALDPTRFRILAVDAIGNGLTTSPSTSRTQRGYSFPQFSISDMVRSQAFLVERLGIGPVDLVVGASMGGMQALAWGVMYPRVVRRIVALTPMARTAPWARLVNTTARSALENGIRRRMHDDPSSDPWYDWVPLMQALAMRTPGQFDAEISDCPGDRDGQAADPGPWLDLRRSWWRSQGFDPIDWIYQSRAYDQHDVGRLGSFNGDTVAALRSIRAPTFIAAPALDLYNPADAAIWASRHIPHCCYMEIDSGFGHMAATGLDQRASRDLNDAVAKFIT